jgi:hypothetical protein
LARLLILSTTFHTITIILPTAIFSTTRKFARVLASFSDVPLQALNQLTMPTTIHSLPEELLDAVLAAVTSDK